MPVFISYQNPDLVVAFFEMLVFVSLFSQQITESKKQQQQKSKKSLNMVRQF